MSRQAPHVLEQAADFTWSTGDLLVPGPNWEVIGTGDLNGDGRNGDLLWQSNDQYNRIAFWMIGQTNFLEGDYLTYNGQEVTIDADLGGIGTYTANRHLNLIWNDRGEVLNWQMARSDLSSGGAGSVDSSSGSSSDRDDDQLNPQDGSENSDLESPVVLGPLAYRLSDAWRMNENGVLSLAGFDFFDGYPADLNQGSENDFSGGSGSSGGSDEESSDSSDSPIELPDLGDVPSGGGIPDTTGGVTVPDGISECDYLCQLDRNDPTGWPPEFQTAPPEVIQSIWDILVDGLLESYDCDPCPVVEVPTGSLLQRGHRCLQCAHRGRVHIPRDPMARCGNDLRRLRRLNARIQLIRHNRPPPGGRFFLSERLIGPVISHLNKRADNYLQCGTYGFAGVSRGPGSRYLKDLIPCPRKSMSRFLICVLSTT